MKKNMSIQSFKSKQLYVLAIVFVLLTQSKGMAQTIMNESSPELKAAYYANAKWNPVKIPGKESNQINGVSINSKIAVCGEQQVSIVRLTNANAFAVTVNYETNKGLKQKITIPAASYVEGNCDVFMDSDLNNPLKVLIFIKTDSDEQKNANKKILSTLEVIKKL